jgi:endoglucanase
MIGANQAAAATVAAAAPPAAASPHPASPHLPALGPADRQAWQEFCAHFIRADGRVIDTGNHGISHSEGQGWGLLFAVSFDDRRRFDSILGWTLRNLRRDEDSLLRWRYDPRRPDPVDDPNNATDGDLFVAWALWKAAWRWQDPRYAALARQMAQDMLNLLVAQAGPRMLLLPGVQGFETADSVVLNPSYYCFPALRELAQAVPSPVWAQLSDDGLQAIDAGRFGRWRLPPDWLIVGKRDGGLAPAPGWPPRFSYDAIRIPLYLNWGGHQSGNAAQAFSAYCAATAPCTPAWIDLRNDNVADYGWPQGMVAVANLAAWTVNRMKPYQAPSIRSIPDYYSSALILLSRIAASEIETNQSD